MDRRVTSRARHGASARALLWLVGGLVLAALGFVAVSPEVASSEPGLVLELMGVASLAAVPGIVLLVVFVIRRKRLGLDDGNHRSRRTGSPLSLAPHPDKDR